MHFSLKLAELFEDLLDLLLLFSDYLYEKMVDVQGHSELIFVKALFPLFFNTLGFLRVIIKFINEVPDRLQLIFEDNWLLVTSWGKFFMFFDLERVVGEHETWLLSQRMFIIIQFKNTLLARTS